MTKVYLFAILSSLTGVCTICHSQHSDQGLHSLPFLRSLIKVSVFAILSNLVVYNVCHSQQSNQDLHYFSFPAVWSGSTLIAILSCLIRVDTNCHSHFDQGLHWLPFSAVWSGSTLVAILSLIRVCTIWLKSHQGLYYFPFILSNTIKVYTICHSQNTDQGLHCLPFSAIRSASTMFAIFSSLIRSTLFVFLRLISVHFLPFSAVWSGSTLFIILSSHYQQGLHYLLFSVWSGSTLFAILKSDRGLYYLPLSVWSGSTVFAILSSLIKVYTNCHSL